ncbi:hypothetical protein JCM10213_006122 [Rhodosporidiobolus nylandii]
MTNGTTEQPLATFAPSPSPPARLPPASLKSLPTELKARIVELLAADSLYSARMTLPGGSEEDEFLASRSSLKDLALVNRSFSQLCGPSLWKTLNLKYLYNEDLVEMVQHGASRIGGLVRILKMQASSSLDWQRIPPPDLSPGPDFQQRWDLRRLETTQQVELLVGVGAGGATDEERRKRTHDLLVASLARHLPRLECIEYDCMRVVPNRVLSRLVVDAFAALPSVVSLNVSVGQAKTHAATLRLLIETFPHLHTLSLTSWPIGPSNELSRSCLALASLHHLRDFSFDGSLRNYAELLTTPFHSSLTSLSLTSPYMGPTFDELFTFIERFSATLCHLHLDLGASLGSSRGRSSTSFINLTSLTLLADPIPFTTFLSSPLREVTLTRYPDAPLSDTFSFLSHHAETLAIVHLWQGQGFLRSGRGVTAWWDQRFGAGEVEAIRQWCGTNGVQMQVVEAAAHGDEDE